MTPPHIPPHFFTESSCPGPGTDGKTCDSLDVIQQPVRARMCGFGDKVCERLRSDRLGGGGKRNKYPWLRQHGNRQDRRPITPPPCIRLIVQDAVTRKEVDIKLVSSLPFCFRLMEGITYMWRGTKREVKREE